MFEEALARLEEGLAIQRHIHPERHSTEGMFLNGISCVHCYQGKLEDGLTMYKKALRIYKQTVGPQSVMAAHALNNMANVLFKQGKYDKALVKYEKALTIIRAALGDEHDEVAHTLYGIARCKAWVGDLEGALVSVREAHRIFKKRGISHGTAHDAAALLAILEGSG
mmetsp:Transcript_16644/g.32820  ORF Transcript_16644/g.32820 Transcript_16644/m.32820 type:complete len:167 (+) Transcript_16644:1-501(+)